MHFAIMSDQGNDRNFALTSTKRSLNKPTGTAAKSRRAVICNASRRAHVDAHAANDGNEPMLHPDFTTVRVLLN